MLWIGGVITLILLLFSFALYYFFNQSFIATWENRIYNKSLQIYEKNFNEIKYKKNFNFNHIEGYEVALLKGAKIVSKTYGIDKKDIKIFQNSTKDFLILNHGETITIYYKYKFETPFKGVLFLKRSNIDNDVEDLVEVLLFLDPALLIILLFIIYKVMNKTLRPIQEAAKTAIKTSVNYLPQAIPLPKYHDEIYELIDAFNNMVARLTEGILRIERFNSDVSHELRTPLTVMLGEIDIALRKERDITYLRQTMKRIRIELERLEVLVNSLLVLSRYNSKSIKESFEEVALEQLLLESLELHTKAINEKSLNIKISKFDIIEIYANPTLLRILFTNLIDNAIKYSYSNRQITIKLYRDDKWVYFSIQDEGIGIPSDKLNKITERFYRVDEARSRKVQGFGLGLALVEKITALHNGTLHIDSIEGKGTIVNIKLPYLFI